MKQFVVMASLILGSSSLFAAEGGHSYILRCEIADHTPYQQNREECPSLVKSTLDKMGCGGEVEFYRLTSPGAPYSTVDVQVKGSSCPVPAVLKGRAYCEDKSAKRLELRDYDQSEGYDGQISTLVRQGLAGVIRYLCSK